MPNTECKPKIRRKTRIVNPKNPLTDTSRATVVYSMLYEYFLDEKATIAFLRAHASTTIVCPSPQIIEMFLDKRSKQRRIGRIRTMQAS